MPHTIGVSKLSVDAMNEDRIMDIQREANKARAGILEADRTVNPRDYYERR